MTPRAILRVLLLFTLLGPPACSSDTAPLTGRPDGAAQDATPADARPTDASWVDARTEDAAPLDGAEVDAAADASLPDTLSTDAAGPDAAAADSGVDAGPSCGLLGKSCSNPETCGAGTGLVCLNNFCMPDGRPDCGGFVMAQCNLQYPVCRYYLGADYGTCLLSFERSCLCAMAQPPISCP